jgi:hypothetical protein
MYVFFSGISVLILQQIKKWDSHPATLQTDDNRTCGKYRQVLPANSPALLRISKIFTNLVHNT